MITEGSLISKTYRKRHAKFAMLFIEKQQPPFMDDGPFTRFH